MEVVELLLNAELGFCPLKATSYVDLLKMVHGEYIRSHKQYSLFHIPARTQFLELIVSHECGKFADSALWKLVGN